MSVIPNGLAEENITMCTFIDKLRCIGRGVKRSPRVLLMGAILVLCVVAHIGVHKIQLQHQWTHEYYKIRSNTTPRIALVYGTLDDESPTRDLLDELLLFNQYDNDKDPIFEGTSISPQVIHDDNGASGRRQQRQSEDFMLPTRPRATNQLLYRKDSTKRLNDTWTEKTRAEWQEVLRGRKVGLQEACRISNLTGDLSPDLKDVYTHLRWVTKYRLVWCPIFKAASTTWVKQLLLLAGKKKVKESLHSMVRKLYPSPGSAGERDRMLQNFMKLIIVRHPFERLLSAYRDKMLRARSSKDPYVKLQRQISQEYWNSKMLSCNTTVDTSAIDHNSTPTHPSFTQFLKKVRDDVKWLWLRKKGRRSINLHWRPYWATCAPCQVDYNVIAHVETLEWDQEYIIRELGLQNLLLNAHTHASNFDRYNGTSEAVQSYFSQVPVSLLRALAQLYKPDFELFGYSPENYLKMAETLPSKCDDTII